MSDIQAKKKGKKKPGRAPRHGGYSLVIRSGKLPERRTYLRAYLQTARESLVKDLGPEEQDLSAAETILIDRVISKLSIVRCVEESVRETGVFTKRGMLIAVLAKSYLSWANSIRLDLQALGINKRAAEKALDLGRYKETKIQEKAARTSGPSMEAGAQDAAKDISQARDMAAVPEIVVPGATPCDSSGQECKGQAND